MSDTFIKTIADSCAGIAVFSLPNTPSTGGIGGYTNVIGFLSEDPSISMKSNWEAIIPDATALSDWTQLSGMGAVSWIASSKASWKGTDPITLTLNFYLLTYKTEQLTNKGAAKDPKNMPISEQAARFAALLAVSPKESGEGAGRFSDFGINVHGSYRANYFENNENFTGMARNKASDDRYLKYLQNANEVINSSSEEDSTVNIVINGGGKPSQFFTKMLLADATFTPSPVRCGYWSKEGTFNRTSEPLYIKVTATFRLAHTATTTDAVRMFTGKRSL
jgi:hypothetical protein